MRPVTASKPSIHASLFLGLLSGLLTIFAMLMIGLPVLYHVQALENRVIAQQRELIFVSLESHINESEKQTLTTESFSLDLLKITKTDGPLFSQENKISLGDPCRFQTKYLQKDNGDWFLECEQRGPYRIQFAWQPKRLNVSGTLFYIVLISLFSGIVLAMSVVKVLKPLNRIVYALEQIGQGAQNVPLEKTGYYEFDLLIDRVLCTAQDIQEKEDVIMGRLKLVKHLARLVAHELRNPLQSLEMLTTVLVEENDKSSRERIAKSIHLEIKNLDGVVHRILKDGQSISSSQLHLTQQRLSLTISHLTLLLRAKAQRHAISFSVVIDSDPLFSFDAPLISRAIENLLLNAVQSMAYGGEIQITLKTQQLGLLAVSVRDQGAGVPAQIEGTLFNANITSKPEGTGLGLTLVKAVAEAHHGSISYVRRDKGSTFTLLLPFTETA